MKIFVTTFVFCSILFAIGSTLTPQHHKVRHKHNLHFNGRHINEIREAFVDYKKTIQKPVVTFEEATQLKPLRHHMRNDESKGEEELTPSVDGTSNQRYKRVHATTTHEKLTDNYDEEYDDEGDEKTRRKVTDGVDGKVQVSFSIH